MSYSPVVGGFVAQYKTWRWSQWCMIFITLIVFAIAVPMRETYKPVILKRRAKKLGIVPQTKTASIGELLIRNSIRPMEMLVTEVFIMINA
jgi:MFS family permease